MWLNSFGVGWQQYIKKALEMIAVSLHCKSAAAG